LIGQLRGTTATYQLPQHTSAGERILATRWTKPVFCKGCIEIVTYCQFLSVRSVYAVLAAQTAPLCWRQQISTLLKNIQLLPRNLLNMFVFKSKFKKKKEFKKGKLLS